MLIKGRYNFRVVGISSEPYKSNALMLWNKVKELDREMQGQRVFIVPDDENKYDPNALMVMGATPMGRVCIGYVPATRTCPMCDPDEKERKYKSYGPKQVNTCSCGTPLVPSYAERISSSVRLGASVDASVLFYGAHEGKENIGAVVYATTMLDDASAAERIRGEEDDSPRVVELTAI
jgi:hypothetical protein